MIRRSSMEGIGNLRTYSEALERAGISKAELARRLDVNPRTVSAWQDAAPGYAMAYLNLLIAYNKVRP